MELVDILTIIAILVGPLAAVQASKLVDTQREKRARKYQIYRTLMATRATSLAPMHVEALNSIDLEFSDRIKKESPVRTKWKIYLDHLSSPNANGENWNLKRIDLLVDLLEEMGNCLGHRFDKVHIKNSIYLPTAHGQLEGELNTIRSGIIQILNGNKAIPIKIDSIPPQPN